MHSLELALEASSENLHHLGRADLADGTEIDEVVSGGEELRISLGSDDFVSEVAFALRVKSFSRSIHVLTEDSGEVLMGGQVEEKVYH